MSREHILHKVRTAIGRSEGQEPAEPPAVLLKTPDVSLDERIAQFSAALENLSGLTHNVASVQEAGEVIAELTAGKSVVASNAPILRECGVTGLPGVETGFSDREALREACARADVGITGADYALADTGSVVTMASPDDARLISLLPPEHIAVVRKEKLLTCLDELFEVVPNPAVLSSSLVIITGSSRTADIEQILIKGVHGPRMIHVVLV